MDIFLLTVVCVVGLYSCSFFNSEESSMILESIWKLSSVKGKLFLFAVINMVLCLACSSI